MARPGAFKSEKRKKELTRQKKQEKKRQRRLGKDLPAAQTDAATGETEGIIEEPAETTGAETIG